MFVQYLPHRKREGRGQKWLWFFFSFQRKRREEENPISAEPKPVFPLLLSQSTENRDLGLECVSAFLWKELSYPSSPLLHRSH
jgi:hypothetical protein